MTTAEVRDLVEELVESIDGLEEALAPLLKASLASISSRIPLLDKAKFYTLATYAIESILFSYLRINGVNAKEHAVFKELTRVKEYFAKIKTTETGPTPRTMTLDKAAAARFIKHDLAANTRLDAGMKRKAELMEGTRPKGTHIKFDDDAKRVKGDKTEPSVVVAKADDTSSSAEEVEEGSVGLKKEPKKEKSKAEKEKKKAEKRQRRKEAALAKQSPISDPPNDAAPSVLPGLSKQDDKEQSRGDEDRRRHKKKDKKEKRKDKR